MLSVVTTATFNTELKRTFKIALLCFRNGKYSVHVFKLFFFFFGWWRYHNHCSFKWLTISWCITNIILEANVIELFFFLDIWWNRYVWLQEITSWCCKNELKPILCWTGSWARHKRNTKEALVASWKACVESLWRLEGLREVVGVWGGEWLRGGRAVWECFYSLTCDLPSILLQSFSDTLYLSGSWSYSSLQKIFGQFTYKCICIVWQNITPNGIYLKDIKKRYTVQH